MRKTCANAWCKTGFEVTAEETRLREKITVTFETGPVPPPTLCPDCRMQRRMVWRNERVLYNRKCDLTAKDIISVHHTDAQFPVYDRVVWWRDTWDPLAHGRAFDFSQPFFKQLAGLRRRVPRASLNDQNVENCDYCNFAFDSRNCYLSHCSYMSEALLYCYWLYESKDCTDCSYCFQCEQCLFCTDCNHSHNCVACTLSHGCTDCLYLYDCRSCTRCFGCVGLRNKSHCMFNEQLAKGEYERRLQEFDLQNPMHVAAVEAHLQASKLQHPHRYSIQEQTENCTGDYIFESKDCRSCYQIYRSQDCIYVSDAEVRDCLDGYHPGWSEVQYEVYSSVRQRSAAFCVQCWDGSDNFYSDNCHASSHCFGCISLRHKQYCILNRQYSKKEYLQLLPRIVNHMKKGGEWGEFFPVEHAPFAYNETMAQEYFPLTKGEILARGWKWRDEVDEPPKVDQIIPAERLPDSIDEIPDDILNWAVKCEATGRPFRIVKQELAFYRKMRLPIPHFHPDERHRRRMALRNPRKLWKRSCMKCGKEIETTYSPERPERVYCEECYLATVY